jgi:molecular chaperone DnaK
MIGFGIDFGTTNSVVAVMTGSDRPATPLLDSEGGPHPSVVWYRPGSDPVVGRDAKRNINCYAEIAGNIFISSVKRSLGRNKRFQVLGKTVPAYRVAADIFQHLRQHARQQGWKLDQAVVTVPVHFDGPARRELRAAARAAGIEITAFVHEPFAAAVAYHRQQGYDIESLPDQRLLVFDWGGGTLDITLVQVRGGRLEEIATGGLDGIAGDRFDERIQDWARTTFLDRYQLRPEAFVVSAGTRDRLREECERAKIALSAHDREVVRLAEVLRIDDRPYDLRAELSRIEFESLIRNDVNAALMQLDCVLQEAALSYHEIDSVLLIGGTSNIPLVRREMEKRFGSRCVQVPNAQTIIAEGAAIVAYHRYAPVLSSPIQLQLCDGSWYTIFDADTLVPIDGQKTVTLFCTDNRDGEARLIVRQERHGIDGRIQPVSAVLSVPVSRDLPRPYNHERVYASFTVDEDFVLSVEAHGATRQQVVRCDVHDLRFGLRVR